MGGVSVTLLVVVTMIVILKRKRRQKYASPALWECVTHQDYLDSEHEEEDQPPENLRTSAATAMPEEHFGARHNARRRFDGSSLEVRPASGGKRFQSSSAAVSTTSSRDTDSTSDTAHNSVRENMRSFLALVERANLVQRYHMNVVEEDRPGPPSYNDATGSTNRTGVGS